MFGKKYTKTIKVEGLTCPNCAKKMECNLSQIESVSDVKVDLQNQTIIIKSKKELNNKDIENKFKNEKFNVLYIK